MTSMFGHGCIDIFGDLFASNKSNWNIILTKSELISYTVRDIFFL